MSSAVNKICVVGLGYVGAPLACKLAKHYSVIGFDVNQQRVDELSNRYDKTLEITAEELECVLALNGGKGLLVTTSESELKEANIYIVTVPTPVNRDAIPDLFFLEQASKIVGRMMNINDTVIYESTVYPGATEDVCVPVLEQYSGLKFNKDFFVGYSPERINPGDKVNRLENTCKIISASNNKTLDLLEEIYGSIINKKLHRASSIKIAESAKVIENIQRDVNIALANELSIVFGRMNIDTMEVLEAAATKWNFVKYTPGLVGGHCIGVDPYYLIRKSQALGYLPEIMSGARRLNEKMPEYIVGRVIKKMNVKGIIVKDAAYLILGFTFKENCPDIRNTKVVDIYNHLQEYSQDVDIYDPWVAEKAEVQLLKELDENKKYDAIILAVSHSCFSQLNLKSILKTDGVIYDIKSVLPKEIVDERL